MNSIKKIEIIDFLKGYSIFTIVIYHILQKFNLPFKLNTLINFGGTGIHTFILISGFGLYLSYAKKPIDFFSFFKKRFVKIYIPYIVILFLIVVISLIYPVYPYSTYAVLGHVFLFKMFDESIIGSYGYHLWFISTIIQFYLVFIILARLKSRIDNPKFILIGFILSIAWMVLIIYLGKNTLRVWNSFFLQYLWEFMLGMALADWYQKGKVDLEGPGILKLILICILGLAAFSLFAFKLGTIGQTINDIPGLVGYTALGMIIYKFRIAVINNFFLYTGKISFSLYLLHMFIIIVVFKVAATYGFHNILLGVIVLAICYLISPLLDRGISKIYKFLGY